MRVQVEVSVSIKNQAESQAKSLGYPSLAIMLRVITNGLARDYRANPSMQEVLPATAPGAASVTQSAMPATTNLPPPEQFTHWPKYISRNIYKTDPALYRLLIETGQVS